MSAALRARPGVAFRVASGPVDELVLHGGGEVLRLPRSSEAAARIAVCARVLGRLAPLVPLAVPRPRLVGVTDDGEPFSAEARLSGVAVEKGLDAIAAGQRDGVLAALAAVGERQAREWGVPGDGEALVSPLTLLLDPRRGVLTGAVGWDLRLASP